MESASSANRRLQKMPSRVTWVPARPDRRSSQKKAANKQNCSIFSSRANMNLVTGYTSKSPPAAAWSTWMNSCGLSGWNAAAI
jgi:hypothetical protein